MGLRLQETYCSSQVLKPWKSDQETSEEELFIKVRRQSWQKDFYRDLKLKLDKNSTQAISVRTYEIKNFKSNFQSMLKYLYRVYFLTTRDIYKDYFKGRHVCKKCLSSLFSLKKLLHLYAKGFVTKELPNLHCWWTEELCSQQPLQIAGVSHVLGSMHHWLVTYWDSCIELKDCG